MRIEDSAEHIVWVDLSPEPGMRKELQRLVETALEHGSKDMGVDFFNADIVTSASLASLVRLHKLASSSRAHLVLCNISSATRAIFVVTGLSEVFEICEDRHTAIARMRKHEPAQSRIRCLSIRAFR